jgi:hypothetical protein
LSAEVERALLQMLYVITVAPGLRAAYHISIASEIGRAAASQQPGLSSRLFLRSALKIVHRVCGGRIGATSGVFTCR